MKVKQYDKFDKNWVVSFDTEYGDTLALKEIHIEEYFEQTFICGTIPKYATTNDWLFKKKACIKLSSVTGFVVFENEDDYINSMKLSEA